MPIQILPAQLANQIAAGEVVERPASVVKELVENSLDAGATNIEIDIEKGGHKRINIRDNGKGIDKDQLTLALSRHATSKIQSLDDLEHVASLGFRGEALASVSSVARLNLTSRTAVQSEAWQAHAEGRDMQVMLQPAAHPQGTSVEVLDLFFNTPARRKFLRTEKTEFSHIDELVKRIALSRFDVMFSLKHNGKQVRRLPLINEESAQHKRISAVCGKDFMDSAIYLESQYQGMQIRGWVSAPGSERRQNDLQYFYVNGRMMRDKLINHAIRQAFEGLIHPEHFSAYVLYFCLDPGEVDVNVHPAKHEVRFHQARLVHDFIYRAINDGLQQSFDNEVSTADMSPVEPAHDYIRPLQSIDSSAGEINERNIRSVIQPRRATDGGSSRPFSSVNSPVSASAAENYQQLMQVSSVSQEHCSWWLVDGKSLLINQQGEFLNLPMSVLHGHILAHQFEQQVPVSQPLLMPVSIEADSTLLQRAQALQEPLLACGVEIGWSGKRILVRKVPAGFRQHDWIVILSGLLDGPLNPEKVMPRLLGLIAASVDQFSQQQAQQYWSWLLATYPQDWQKKLMLWGTSVPLAKWLSDQNDS